MDITEFVSKLDQLSAWRKKELSHAQFLAENADNKESQRYLCRAWVLMMYAHCDNFLKEATRLYLIYLKHNLQNVKKYRHELIWLLTCGNENMFSKNYKSLEAYFGDSKNISFEASIMEKILKTSSFQYKLLRYLCDWIMQIKYDHSQYNYFCSSLKKKRDSIAHGEEAYINVVNDCLAWNESTIEFMESLKSSLIENASS